MANGEDEPSRPRQITAANVWDELARLRNDTAQARHDQTDRITRVIGENSKEIRDLVAGVETRVRALEQSTPSSLGGRLGDTEKWQAVMQSANLPSRVDVIESTLDQMRGSLNLLKYLQVLVSFAVGAITLIGFVLIQRPA